MLTTPPMTFGHKKTRTNVHVKCETVSDVRNKKAKPLFLQLKTDPHLGWRQMWVVTNASIASELVTEKEPSAQLFLLERILKSLLVNHVVSVSPVSGNAGRTREEGYSDIGPRPPSNHKRSVLFYLSFFLATIDNWECTSQQLNEKSQAPLKSSKTDVCWNFTQKRTMRRWASEAWSGCVMRPHSVVVVGRGGRPGLEVAQILAFSRAA